MRAEDATSEPQAQRCVFATTHWSVVLAAGAENTLEARAALERLCRTYWYPLYAYVRREGYNPEDAQDLTQGFFAQLLARHSLSNVAPEKGRFRSFLLAAMRHFLSVERERARAVKRGGQAQILSLDAQEAEARYRLEPIERLDAEKIYERRWAMTLLEQAVIRLREESAAAGKAELFGHLRDFISGDREVRCGEVASELGISESAAKSAVHRLRARYRDLVREEIAHTVAEPAEINTEIQYLAALLSQ